MRRYLLACRRCGLLRRADGELRGAALRVGEEVHDVLGLRCARCGGAVLPHAVEATGSESVSPRCGETCRASRSPECGCACGGAAHGESHPLLGAPLTVEEQFHGQPWPGAEVGGG